MRQLFKKFIAYFPILLIILQLIANLLYMGGCLSNGALFYVNTILGTNFLFSLFLVAYTQFFSFCNIGRIAAYTEIALALDVLFVPETHYNLVFQCVIMTAGIAVSIHNSIKKFPNCLIALYVRLTKIFIRNRFNCEKTLDEYKRVSYNNHFKRYHSQ